MTGKEGIELRVRALAAKGWLARSECSKALLAFVAPLIASGVAEWERWGSGQRLRVRNAVLVKSFIAQEFPHGRNELADHVSRVQGVGCFRESKALPNDLPEIVCLRGWGNDHLWCENNPVELARATREFGVFAFVLADRTRYRLEGRCVLVENPAVFSQIERLGLPVDTALLTSGRCSNSILSWLTAPQCQVALLHMPDYDPVGLAEYERMRERLRTRVSLYLPPNLSVLFQRYANAQLLLNSVAQNNLAKLRCSDSPEVRQVVALIDKHNGGLEQEALLIEQFATG